MITLLRELSSDDLSIETELLKITLEKVSNVHDVDLSEIIVEILSSILDNKVNNYKCSEIKEKHTITQAFLGTDPPTHSKIRNKLNVEKRIFPNVISSDIQSISYSPMVKIKDLSFLQKNQWK